MGWTLIFTIHIKTVTCIEVFSFLQLSQKKKTNEKNISASRNRRCEISLHPSKLDRMFSCLSQPFLYRWIFQALWAYKTIFQTGTLNTLFDTIALAFAHARTVVIKHNKTSGKMTDGFVCFSSGSIVQGFPTFLYFANQNHVIHNLWVLGNLYLQWYFRKTGLEVFDTL